MADFLVNGFLWLTPVGFIPFLFEKLPLGPPSDPPFRFLESS